MKVLPETKALGPRARLLYLAGIILSVALIAFGLSLLLSSSTENSTVQARNWIERPPPVETTSIPTYSPSTQHTQHDGTVPIVSAPTDFPSYEQSPAAPSEDPSHAPTASLEESSTGPSMSSSGEPSLSRSVPPSEQPSESPSEAPVTTQPTTLYPSTVQATTPQPTLSSSPTQTIEPRFPEYPEPLNASSAYFNYNLTQGSRFGPSAWKRVSVPAENYWGEFLSLDNQCGNEFGQSPIDLCTAPSRYCQEFHEFRSRPGDFGIEGRSMQKQILANKLVSLLIMRVCKLFCTDMHNRKHEKRVLVERRTGDEPDPPHVDFAGVGARELDLLNIDISFPSEHTVCGKRFAGEMRYYFYHPVKLVFVAIAFLLETSDEAPANGHMQLLIDEFRYLHERHDKLCQWSATERKGSTNVTADEAAEPVRRLRKNAWNPFHPDIQKTVHFWGYTGSLTEPPCSGWSVLWRIMDVPVVLSREQIGQMRTVLFTNRDPKTCLFTSVHSSDAVARPIQRPIRYYKCSRRDYVSDGERLMCGEKGCADAFGKDLDPYVEPLVHVTEPPSSAPVV